MSDQDQPTEEQPCQPCRGTGKVISGLGGGPSTVDCPWCDGSGVFDAERNAQARWTAGQTSDDAA